MSFHSSKQLIQYKKVKYFGDDPSANRIMTSDSPLECKDIAHEITNYDHESWEENAKSLCKDGIISKFRNHNWLQEKLVSIGTKTIVECSRDKIWGRGILLQDENCLDRELWTSQGILGEIL